MNKRFRLFQSGTTIYALIILFTFLYRPIYQKQFQKNLDNFDTVSQSMALQLENKSINDLKDLFSEYHFFSIDLFESNKVDYSHKNYFIEDPQWRQNKNKIIFEMQRLKQGWIIVPETQYYWSFRSKFVVRYIQVDSSNQILGVYKEYRSLLPSIVIYLFGVVFIMIIVPFFYFRKKVIVSKYSKKKLDYVNKVPSLKVKKRNLDNKKSKNVGKTESVNVRPQKKFNKKILKKMNPTHLEKYFDRVLEIPSPQENDTLNIEDGVLTDEGKCEITNTNLENQDDLLDYFIDENELEEDDGKLNEIKKDNQSSELDQYFVDEEEL